MSTQLMHRQRPLQAKRLLPCVTPVLPLTTTAPCNMHKYITIYLSHILTIWVNHFGRYATHPPSVEVRPNSATDLT